MDLNKILILCRGCFKQKSDKEFILVCDRSFRLWKGKPTCIRDEDRGKIISAPPKDCPRYFEMIVLTDRQTGEK